MELDRALTPSEIERMKLAYSLEIVLNVLGKGM